MSGAIASRPRDRTPSADARPDRLTAWCDGALDAVIVLMATWTVVYDVAFLFHLGSNLALGLEGAALIGAVVLVRSLNTPRVSAPDARSEARSASRNFTLAAATGADRGRPRSARETRRGWRMPRPRFFEGTRLVWIVLASAVVAAVGMALSLPWLLVWVPWLVAGVAGSAWALLALPKGADLPAPPPTAPTSRVESRVVLGAAVAFAVLSLVTLRPNPDDLFYVNLSQWVAAHGTFPHQDTIWADLVYPMANWPPLAGYDPGVGAVAHLLGLHAGTVVYVLVPPIATLLSVLALWRLLRAWRVPHVLLALAAAGVFLMLDGTSSYGPPGNLWVTRLWQGKVVLLCVVVPVLYVMAVRFAEAPSRRRAGWLFVGGVASVACTTTAAFLVPVVAVAGAAPLLRRSPRLALASFVSMAAYPLGASVVTTLVGGRSADDFGSRRQYRFDPSWFGHEVFLTGAVALVGVLAVLIGPLVVPHPAARVTTAVAVVLTGITFVPGLTHLTYDLVGLGPTLWRLTWSLSIAALVGTVASYAVVWLRGRISSRRVLAGLLVAVVATLGVLGHPILSSDTTTSFAMPPHWQRGADSVRATSWILDHTRPGDRVLGPDGLSITVAVTTTAVKTVTPRDYYMYYLRDTPGFDYDQRLTLTEFANHEGDWRPVDVAPALQALDVRVACVYRTDHDGSALLRAAGYLTGTKTETYRCLVAPPAG